jgi:hypothetical protein
MRDNQLQYKEKSMKRAFQRRGILIGIVGVMFTGFSLIAGIAASAVAASGVPYTDTRAVGSIGLCNAAGQAITKGSIHDVPFVTKAIDSTPAAAPYNGPGETATLFIYQPRQSVLPAEWHGEQLGASSRSSTPQHPTAIMTAGDGPLAAALADYPPQWDGFMQLRIFLGAPNQPIYNSTYDATDIKITGDTWQVVRGDSVPCGNGQSVSLEQVLASSFPQLTASPSASGGSAGTPNAAGKSPGSSGKPAAGTSAGTGAPASGDNSPGASAPASGSAIASTEPRSGGAAGSGSGGSHGGSSLVLWILIAVGVVGVGAAAIQWSRSRPVGTRRA